MTHPSDLKLERHLLDPERSELRPHLAACESCRARIERMEREGESFRRYVYPATLDAVSAPRRRPWGRWAVAALAPAMAASLLLVVRSRPAEPPSDYVGAKGARLTLEPFTEGGTRAINDGEAVPADAALRFRVRAATTCRLWLLSVDADGNVSRLSGPEAIDVRGQIVTPGGARLDGRPGPERFFAVCAPGSLGYTAVEQAGKAVAAAGERGVRDHVSLPGLPGDAAQASILVEKKR